LLKNRIELPILPSYNPEHILRTPDERFENIVDFPYEPSYADVLGLRMSYIDTGPADAQPVLLMHGEPSWSFLYRKMIPIITAAGHRVIAPDLVGFGRSDKPTRTEDYTYKLHVDTVAALVEHLDLGGVTFFGQDWGGSVGLRVVAEDEERFARVVVANTGLSTGDHRVSDAFLQWRELSQKLPVFDVGALFRQLCPHLTDEEVAGYEAPFPDESYKAGARIFPVLVPITPDDPASEANRQAWEVFRKWEKPFLTAFSDNDPITRGGDRVFKKLVPGAEGQPHVTIEGAGHFLQDDKGEEVAQVVVDFIASTG
jgi:haloalkane dehalogenase